MKKGYKKYKDINERYSAFIDGSKLLGDSKKILWEWVKERQGNSLKDNSTLGLIGTVIGITEEINRDLTKITRKDLQKYFTEKQLKSTTELWYKKVLKRFYYWLSQNKDNPKYLHVTNWINTKELSRKCTQHAQKKREDNLITPEEVRKMVSKAVLLRDKLAISFLADTGVRAESVGASTYHKRSINVGQVEFQKGYATIKDIEEKFDKKRNIIVTEALSYLIKYWNELPEDYRKKEDNPLFMAYSNNRYGKRWGYSGLKDMLHKVSKQALGRIINPHDFRHLKGTRLHLDENLSDDAKCKLMGWTSRRMLDRYNHTKFDDAKREYLEKKGIIKIDKKKVKVEPSILKPKECLVCHHINSSTDGICEQCGNSLDYESMIKDFTQKQGIDRKALLIIKTLSELNPNLMEELVKSVKKLRG